MRVVSVRVKNIRPYYSNLKEWMEGENNVYIGRKGVVIIDGERVPKDDSTWCNPFKITDTEDRNSVIHKYTVYILERLRNDNNLLEELLSLRGKTIGCWCKPDACHGDVLVNIVAYYNMYGILPAYS